MGTIPIPLSTTSLIRLRLFGNHLLCTVLKSLDHFLDGIELNPINTVQGILSGKKGVSHDRLYTKNAGTNIEHGFTLECLKASLFVNPQNHVLLEGCEALHIVAVHVLVHIDQSVVTPTDGDH